MQRWGLFVVWGVLGYHFWLFCPKESLFWKEETVKGIPFEDGTGAVVAQAVAGGPGRGGLKNVKMSNDAFLEKGFAVALSKVRFYGRRIAPFSTGMLPFVMLGGKSLWGWHNKGAGCAFSLYMAQPISLSEHFGYRKLLRFTVPSMVMMVFTSIYSIVDGMFVSNFVGKTPFAAINLVMPFLMVLGVIGYMLGTGGSALVAKLLGEGQERRARRVFSLLVVAGVCVGVVFGAAGIGLLPRVSVWLGADEAMVGHCVQYGRIILLALPFFVLQYMFQSLMVTAERPKLGLWVTVAAGLMNIVLDFVLIVVFGLGLKGAAWATAASQVTGGLLPLVYFLCPNSSRLRLVVPVMDWRALVQACSNGLSEFFGNVSGSIVSMCYNYQLMKYIGQDGVSAYGVIMYVQFIFFAVFLGYTMGSSPIVSFCHGARNHDELHNVFSRSLRIIGALGIVLTVAIELLAWPLTKAFVGYDPALFDLTRRAFMIYGASYLLVGFNFYASAFFTALNNGVLSAVLSTARALVFETAAVFVLPALFGAGSIWFSVVVAEVLSLGLSVTLLATNRKRYNY